MGIAALVFDFGNVVGFFSHRRASERLAALAGLDADKVHRVLFGSRLEDDYESGRLTTAAFLAEVRRACGLTCADEVIAASYADIFWPNPDVCALLPRLARRYPLLMVSNTNDLHARRFQAQFAEELRPFRHRVLSHEVGARKPKREIFAHAERLAGCAPHELVFIDDLPGNVEGALACGWRGIVYAGVEELRQQLAALGVEVE
jgi:putative hydrolase of the HAD superfamily